MNFTAPLPRKAMHRLAPREIKRIMEAAGGDDPAIVTDPAVRERFRDAATTQLSIYRPDAIRAAVRHMGGRHQSDKVHLHRYVVDSWIANKAGIER